MTSLWRAGRPRSRNGKAQITIPPGPRLGDMVLEAEDVGKGFGDRLLIDDLSFKLPPGGIVGVIGPNGAGKTTLFRMIVGQEKPDAGTIRVGETVKLGYVDQSRDALDAQEDRVGGNLRRQRHDQARQARGADPRLCRLVQLQGAGPAEEGGPALGRRAQPRASGEDAESGRESDAARRADQRSRRRDAASLEEALEDFPGCAMVISHDRFFLDRIATHILSFEGDSHVEWFEGNFQSYEEDKKRRLGDAAVLPNRIKYKKFARA